jgi:outer membrane murein-binding lipoprotein Lpp
MSLAAAAAALKVHPRTIERRIASGKIQSRRADDGQLQVLVDVPDTQPTMCSSSPEALETVKELAQDQVTLATGSASAIVRLAQTDAQRARHDLALVRHEVEQVRRSAKLAWLTVGSMAAVVCAAVAWATYTITRSTSQIETLNATSHQIESEARQFLSERDAARQEADRARLAGAEASGRLAAYQEQAQQQAQLVATHAKQSDNRPTTRPANIIQRLADAMAGG